MNTTRRFGTALLIIVVAALALRVAYVVGAKWNEPMVGDQIFYNAAANNLARGEGFVEPFDPQNPLKPGSGPAADHPPLTIVVLAPVSWLTHQDPNAQRLTMALLGALVVAAIGLVGREVAGDRAGLMAAGIAAVYPNLWVNDGLIMSETLAVLAVTLALLLAYRMARTPSVLTAFGLGVACGFAAMARAELLLLVFLLALPAVFFSKVQHRAERGQAVAVMVVGALLIVGPWVVFNFGRFQRPTLLSTNDGIALLGSNCGPVYSGHGIGLTDLGCLPKQAPAGDQSVASGRYRYDALRYARDHADRIPAVVLARVGRVWSVFRPADMLSYNVGEGQERWVTGAGLVFYYPIVLLAIGGAIILRRHFDRLWPLLVPMVVVTIAAAVTYGQTRFRAPAEPSLVVLAAVAIDALLPGGIVHRANRPRSVASEAVLEPLP